MKGHETALAVRRTLRRTVELQVIALQRAIESVRVRAVGHEHRVALVLRPLLGAPLEVPLAPVPRLSARNWPAS